MGIPMDMDEAARIDGAGSFRIWAQVILPLAGPVLATLAIFNFQATWNDFLWPLVITNTENMRTIPIGLEFVSGPIQHRVESADGGVGRGVVAGSA